MTYSDPREARGSKAGKEDESRREAAVIWNGVVTEERGKVVAL